MSDEDEEECVLINQKYSELPIVLIDGLHIPNELPSYEYAVFEPLSEKIFNLMPPKQQMTSIIGEAK